VTEHVLLDRLEELGGRVRRPYVATTVRQTADGAEVELESGERVEARYVIAADGMDSTIRDQAGLGFDGDDDTLPLSFSLADVRVEGDLPTDQVLLFFSTHGILVVAPLPDGSFRLVADVDEAPEQPDISFTQELLSVRGPEHEVRVTDVVWGSRFRIHERVAQRYRAGRVVLAGDAAHTHSPAGGQGMNPGLREAVRLGEALSGALKEDREEQLDEWEAGSRAEALQVVALTHRLTRLATAPRMVRPLRNVGLRLLARVPRFRRAFAEQLSAIGHR
jgi:2-polyprenyl-6-methoxyphenol hydroxylase-like FAD-dependent oxidoreductase